VDQDTKEMLDKAKKAPVSVEPEQKPEETTLPSEPSKVAPVTGTVVNRAPFHKQKKIIIAAVVSVLLLGGILWFLLSKDGPTSQTTQDSSQAVTLLGTAVALIDGDAEMSSDSMEWAPLTQDSTVAEGSSIRTSASGRVVINLDDGSAVRINNGSTVTFTSLAANDVKIANENGEVYTRVVESDRAFNVTVGDESYTALGTAYKTVNRDSIRGVEVYQSEVSVKTAGQKISEGKRYYQANPTPELDKQISDIPVDQLQKDTFLQWNLDQDKKSDEFKDKLGYFTTLEKTPAPAAATPAPSPTAGIVLSGSKTEKGVSLSWKVTGLAVSKGFKVVKGTATNPTLGKQDATFVDASVRSMTWKLSDGKTYHFRVCIYNSDGSCTNYSNNIVVTAPSYSTSSSEPTGSLTLSHVAGSTVSWTLNGSAPYGLKLVWSTSPGPAYPGANVKFYDGESNSSATFQGDSGQKYYIRVCMFYESTCKNYSNEIEVTLP
jgi:hypothetical protein